MFNQGTDLYSALELRSVPIKHGQFYIYFLLNRTNESQIWSTDTPAISSFLASGLLKILLIEARAWMCGALPLDGDTNNTKIFEG